MSRQLLVKINNRKRSFLCRITKDPIQYAKLVVVPSLEWYENKLLSYHKKLSIGSRVKIRLYDMDGTRDIVWSGWGTITAFDMKDDDSVCFHASHCALKPYRMGKNEKAGNNTEDR